MREEAAVFEKTYRDYLFRISEIDLAEAATCVGADMEQNQAVISLFNRSYRVSKTGIVRDDGKRPKLGTCVILSRYLLMCPSVEPTHRIWRTWASFRDFKDSGPLTAYWTSEVEGALVGAFSGRLRELAKAAAQLGGYTPDTDFPYDAGYCFDALPKISMLLLFNDTDEEFPARCTVLFKASAEAYLDGECLAMLGAQLAGRLIIKGTHGGSGSDDH